MTTRRPVPSLGLSTGGLPHFDAHDLVLLSLELGVRHIQTSPSYDNESAVGGALAVSDVERADVFVSSSLGCHEGDAERLFDSFDVTLDLLGLREIDLLLLSPDGPAAHWKRACDALRGLQQEGVVHRLGVAVDDAATFDEVARGGLFDVVEMPSHPGRPEQSVRHRCADMGWDFIADSPFGRQGVVPRPVEHPVIADLAATHGASAWQIVLAWAISKPGSAAVFPSASPDELSDHWESRRIELSDSDLAAIDALDS